METTMNSEQAQRLTDLTAQLSETLMTAAICAGEIRIVLRTELDGRTAVRPGRSQEATHRNPPRERPLVDDSTLSVLWAGKICPLRHTILFRLAERLARRPNQYVTSGQLLRDVWEGGVKSPDTIRSTVRHLRQRLSEAGMDDLAARIHGTGGRYGLMLDGSE
jgi:DNA-binding response OmpR family regulator